MITTADIYTLIEEARQDLNWSQAEVAKRAFGQDSSAAIQGLRRGKSPGIERISAMCDVLGLELYVGPRRREADVDILMTTGDDTRPLEVKSERAIQERMHSSSDPRDDFDLVERFDLTLSAGPGAAGDNVAALSPIAFRRDWLRSMFLSAKDCVVMSVGGDSMLPTVHDGDLVLVDRKPQQQLSYAYIYALSDIDGQTRVKRIQTLDEGYLLQSDNPNYEVEVRFGDDANRVKIIGRVVWSSHKHGVSLRKPPQAEKPRPKTKPFKHVWF
jgi:phage repressor protein C with HTH and peptisase S24 domain